MNMKNNVKRVFVLALLLLSSMFMLASCDEEDGEIDLQGSNLQIGTQENPGSPGENGEGTPNGGSSAEGGDDAEDVGTPHVHSFDEWVTIKASTCKEHGERERSCECGAKENESIPLLAHNEVIDIAVSPTCVQTGLSEGKHCADCLTVIIDQETLAALGHNEVIDVAVPPTCDQSGLTEGKHCSTCFTVLVVQNVIPSKGHTPGDWVVSLPATISVNGLMYQLCTDCDTKLKEEVILATGSLGLAYKPVFSGIKICTVTGIGTCSDKDLYIGSLIEEHRVLHIGTNAFEGCTFLESVTLPDGLESIASFAFKDCVNLKDIHFPGTKAEWIDFQKGFGWDEGIPSYTVHCTDGDISK
ncbi:MAG: leucine-rich repeat protein [Clostridia bacterium]|nr:leucine-rich repeat protein [Clostridia bacterium]